MYFKSYGWRKIPAKPKKCHFEASKVATLERPKQGPHWEKLPIAPDDAPRSSKVTPKHTKGVICTDTNSCWVILKPISILEGLKKAYFAPRPLPPKSGIG